MNEVLVRRLDAIIQERHLLQHPFYQAWNQGALTLPMLQNYAQEYYLQVKAFPAYVSATHSACDNLEVRRMLLENLIEEEHGAANHPELWLRFAEALGVDRQAMEQRQHLPETKASVATLRRLTRQENPAIGLAALYAYESQIPEIATTKIAGLKRFYGIDSRDGLLFFSVHEQADVIHRQVTREALSDLCTTETDQEAAIAATREAADALNLLLDGVYANYCQRAA
ncbi:MAG: CADD family putative folate metabolism protein [Cyanobacteria bacterium]|nr:CADD family putative folate metabolism protein [Cyanobacteriota bacterium]MDW8201239.1 CADD family putative folate metabolism protein [Cyanobacteriota bacterium SKYGB_h_bin112]